MRLWANINDEETKRGVNRVVYKHTWCRPGCGSHIHLLLLLLADSEELSASIKNVFIYGYVKRSICLCTVWKQLSVYAHICKHIYAHVYVRVRTYTYICIHTYVCVCVLYVHTDSVLDTRTSRLLAWINFEKPQFWDGGIVSHEENMFYTREKQANVI